MDQGSMSTVIEHGVVDPKPTVKAVAYCKGPIFLTKGRDGERLLWVSFLLMRRVLCLSLSVYALESHDSRTNLYLIQVKCCGFRQGAIHHRRESSHTYRGGLWLTSLSYRFSVV